MSNLTRTGFTQKHKMSTASVSARIDTGKFASRSGGAAIDGGEDLKPDILDMSEEDQKEWAKEKMEELEPTTIELEPGQIVRLDEDFLVEKTDDSIVYYKIKEE